MQSHADGDTRFVESGAVTAHLPSIVGAGDLIVGTEEEIHIAGGATDTICALKRLRGLTDAALVVKRGAGTTTLDRVSFTNSGTVEARSGTLKLLQGGGTGSGLFDAAGGTLVFADDYLLDAASQIRGTGTVQFEGSGNTTTVVPAGDMEALDWIRRETPLESIFQCYPYRHFDDIDVWVPIFAGRRIIASPRGSNSD